MPISGHKGVLLVTGAAPIAEWSKTIGYYLGFPLMPISGHKGVLLVTGLPL